jgi:hypothetical protein
MNFAGNFCKACSLDFTNLIKLSSMQGVYYYFYQLLRNEAEARAQKSKKRGNADASVGMLTSLVIAALAGYKFLLLLTLQVVSYLQEFCSALFAGNLYCFHFRVWRCSKSFISTP